MEYYNSKINGLIEQLQALPGIGARTAARLAFFIVSMPDGKVDALLKSIHEAKEHTRYCKVCGTLTDQEVCPICADKKRDHKTIMVVENSRDLAAYEQIGRYNGVYHVLNGVISPMQGIGPEEIRLKELIERLKGDVTEVIVATNPSTEGEATAVYISKLIKPAGIRVSRIASGVPVGGDIECIDKITLLKALDGRVSL